MTDPFFEDVVIVIGSGSHGAVEHISSREANPRVKNIERNASKELGNRTSLHHFIFGSN